MIRRPMFPDFKHDKPPIDLLLFVWLAGVMLLAVAWLVGNWLAGC